MEATISKIAGCDVPLNEGSYRRVQVDFLAALTSDTKKNFNGSAIAWKNVGNTIVKFGNSWTVQPGEFLHVGNPGTYDIVDQQFDIQFGDENVLGTSDIQGQPIPAIPRVEVMRMTYIIQTV